MLTRVKAFARRLESFVEGRASSARGGGNEELKPISQKPREKDKRIEKLREQVAEKDRELEKLRARLYGDDVEPSGVRPEDIVWIIGSPRTGSTWLSRMLGELEGCGVWEEPFFGVMLSFRDNLANQRHVARANFLFGEPNKPIWLKYMRRLLLAVGEARFGGHERLVIKEPNGSVGSRLVLEAFPESSVILLVRDPRDVVASLLDAARPGSWYRYDRYEASVAAAQFDPETGSFAFPQPPTEDELVEHLSRDVATSLSVAREAFDAHGGRKVLVRYEDLRADTMGTMKKLCSALQLVVNEEQLAQAVKRHSWENIPEEKKGQGKFRRKASPGGWREDLTSEQVEVVERITAPLLKEFYSE